MSYDIPICLVEEGNMKSKNGLENNVVVWLNPDIDVSPRTQKILALPITEYFLRKYTGLLFLIAKIFGKTKMKP